MKDVDNALLDLATEEHSSKLVLLKDQIENEKLRSTLLLQQLKCEETRCDILQLQLSDMRVRHQSNTATEHPPDVTSATTSAATPYWGYIWN